jgi:tRNA pseudouridine55 synthase
MIKPQGQMTDKTTKVLKAMPAGTDPSGLILLNKNPGLTSFQSLGLVKRALHTKKAGHTGTLDKFAGGLLLILTGRALKLAPWFSGCDKEYEAVIRFGTETDTLDPEGSVIAEAPLPDRVAFEKALPLFTGSIQQAPPAYSAIHVDGKRAYELARSGNAPEMKKRSVSIYKLDLVSWTPPLATIQVHCSSGTYIRALARDLALASGSRAHLAELTRTSVAGFSLADALGTGGNANINSDSITAALQPINTAIFRLLKLPWFEIKSHDVQKIIQGKPLDSIIEAYPLKNMFLNDESSLDGISAGVFCADKLIAMIRYQNNRWTYAHVFGEINHAYS